MDSNTHSPRSLPIPRASDFFVPTIPSLPDSNTRLTVYAGHLPARDPAPGSATGTDAPRNLAHLYFLLLRARHTADKKRLIIWFNGGPGCSSFDGAMMEIGAWRPDGKGGLEWTKEGGAWNEYADVLFCE